jgi:hypothetical protein
MHVHAGDFCSPEDESSEDYSEYFGTWLRLCVLNMPKLKTITVNIYADQDDVQEAVMRKGLIEQLDGLTSLDRLTELRLITMKDSTRWRSKNAEKSVLVHWKRGSDTPLQAMASAAVYKEDCCI